jgi:UDP-glucose 4-epimerase
MILIVGGLNGFVGSNTTEALVAQGSDCVVTRHENMEVPSFLERHINRHVFVEPGDATSIEDLRRIGEKHKIDGIVNAAGGFTTVTKSPVPGLKGYFEMLETTFQLADEWKVKRVTMSSTGGVYIGLPGTMGPPEIGIPKPVNEEVPIPLPSLYPIIAYQKIVEVAMAEFTRRTGISSACVRLVGMFGPWQDPAQGNLPQRLVQAAINGTPVNLQGTFLNHADDGVDLCYIKDLARAVALLQTAEKLSHQVYNVCSGEITLNRELAEAVEAAVPGFKSNIPPGRTPFTLPPMDITWLRDDTGFTPEFDIPSAIRNYAEWLRQGNPK